MTATVEYSIGTYSGTIEVSCDENDDNEYIIARAKSALRRKCGASIYPSGCCYEQWEVVDRSES